jgi:hypothetical protein
MSREKGEGRREGEGRTVPEDDTARLPADAGLEVCSLCDVITEEVISTFFGSGEGGRRTKGV